MLYILHVLLLLVWLLFLICKNKLSWHTIVNVYALTYLAVDFPEAIFNFFLSLYKFHAQLLKSPALDNCLALLFSDGMILPLGSIILTYYCTKIRPWLAALICALVHIVLEVVYLRFRFMSYIHWNLLYSSAFYLVGIGIYSRFAPRFVNYDPPIPHRIHLLSVGYTAVSWFGITTNGLLRLYQYKSEIFRNEFANTALPDISLCFSLGLACAIIIPNVKPSYKLAVFIGLGVCASVFAWYLHARGTMVYHKWNHVCTILRYCLPLLLVFMYDKWETNYLKRKLG